MLIISYNLVIIELIYPPQGYNKSKFMMLQTKIDY